MQEFLEKNVFIFSIFSTFCDFCHGIAFHFEQNQVPKERWALLALVRFLRIFQVTPGVGFRGSGAQLHISFVDQFVKLTV